MASKKRTNLIKRVILYVILAASLVAGVVLVSQNQNINESAKEACLDDSDCGSGYKCDGGQCKKSGSSGCESNNDCPKGQECKGGSCKDKPVTSQKNCSTSCSPETHKGLRKYIKSKGKWCDEYWTEVICTIPKSGCRQCDMTPRLNAAGKNYACQKGPQTILYKNCRVSD